MPNLLEVTGPCCHALVADRPVTRQEYRDYARAAGVALPPTLSGTDHPARPVTCISQDEASAYCRWLGKREGRPYRLPSMAELEALHSEAAAEGISPEVWPAATTVRPPRWLVEDVSYCEWAAEQTVFPRAEGEPRRLGSIFYPPWLREGANATHTQARMLASDGYSFVSFRVAMDAI